MIGKSWLVRPKLDFVRVEHGAEPNLYGMIYNYYRGHFDQLASRILTEKYIKAWNDAKK